ncbi:WD repeat-containing protein [Pseudomassariella vexata]|uniref:WD repeat-containing protein n=1 Tax=Pseudomassariella vexata TaxID=1141098 RepID=A0A1Y2E7U1_9PEZI|nr:WD repeat-containing protein [Pseudomassariella vexata]ORY67643.1 WD repeat-containing protein [Pseudomassariella vexata]
MPSMLDQAKKGKTINSACDSETFDADVTIHVDGLVGSATISPSGRDVALASPDGLAIIDLDSPYSTPRRLSSHGLPWLVVDVQWSPFAARDYWVASTANHRCLIWNLNKREDSANGAIEHSLHGHSRAITDVNFSAHHPDILATCAVDGFVHSWDLRKPRQPVLTFCDWFAGATQVKYNRQDPFIIASSHDRWLHIWDERKVSKPLKSINAHTSKIYGLDWNRTEPTSVVTCSLDKTIKLWDYAVSDEPQRIIRTDFPVWRARHTPFGWGLLAMPQNDPGHLYLYDTRRDANQPQDGNVAPVAMFPGHGNHKVKEFLWRSRGGVSEDGIDKRDFQLVSWGEDNELRLHRVDSSALENVGYVKGSPARKKLNLTRKGAAYKTYRSVDDHWARERKSATMSDPRPGSGGIAHRRSALTSGMQSMSSHYRPGAISTWRGPSMKAKSTAGKHGDGITDQLGWMKGITLSKRKTTTAEPQQRRESKDSVMFSSSYHDDHWGEPETLQDEIIRVNQQLPNVHWENVDMNALTLDASLMGPWGTNGDTIYIKVKVDIPTSYPRSRAPSFFIEKTALMPDPTYKQLDQDVNLLATQFAKKKQNCLEVAFSYLLGETDLTTSQSFFKNVRDLDDDIEALADDSSSEDEDNDIPTGGSASMSQELTASVEFDATLAPANRQPIPPIPRLCGARWSNDGRLVCFFPSPEEKARALLFAPTDTFKERPKGEPTFAGFGRLQQDSPPPRQRNLDDMSMADDHSDSDDADDSSSSSSDSENIYMHKVNMWYLPGRRFRKAFSGSYSLRSSGGGTGVDTGTGTGTGTGTSRRKLVSKPKNIVSIHDLSDILPSKRELAQEYAIFGDGAYVCEHNAQVAEKHGRIDLTHVWKYAALLLRKNIPLELLEKDQRKNSILIIAKDVVSRFRSGETSGGDSNNPALLGRVKWGLHPLAKDYISELFDYFEKMADVQMLAMLSCIFSEAFTEDSVAYAESNLTLPETPLPMKAPAFSLDYLPPDAPIWQSTNYTAKSQAASGVSTPKTANTPLQVSGSYGSEGAVWPGDPASNSYSCGETPPTRTPYDNLSEADTTQSLSTSPEPRPFRRANTTLTAGFAANFPRPFVSTASSSPPSRKRPSPGENFLANLNPSNITWGGSTVLGPTSEPATTARNSYSDDELLKNESLSLTCYDISVEVEDQGIFDDDGWLTTPLLDSSRNLAYSNYRYAYADMLQMWKQPLARLEILKFNMLKAELTAQQPEPYFCSLSDDGFDASYPSNDNHSHTTLTHHGANSPMPLGKKEELQSLMASERGLDVTGICHVHETHLDPIRSSHAITKLGGAVGNCDRCKRMQMQLLCVYCCEPIDAQYVTCLGCGCTFHDACLAEWHGMGETECPGGDECNCVEQAYNGTVETWAAMMGALRQGRIRGPPIDQEDKDGSHVNSGSVDKNDWETITTESPIPAADGQGRPLDFDSQPPLSAAKLSLGNRLRKSAGHWSSSASLRKKSTTTNSGLGRR